MRLAIVPRELRGLALLALSEGWTITPAGSGHLKWRSPGGALVISSASPSRPNAANRHRALLRAAGLDTSQSP